MIQFHQKWDLFIFDVVRDLGFASNWATQAWACMDQATHVYNDSKVPGALDDDPLDYYVITQQDCVQYLPWLKEKSVHPLLLKLASMIGLKRPGLVLGGKRGINMNFLKEGQSYQKHTDGNLITSVAFASTIEGGELVLERDGKTFEIEPEKNKIAMFSGKTTPHYVKEVIYGPRISLLFSYDEKGKSKDKELEDALYREDLSA